MEKLPQQQNIAMYPQTRANMYDTLFNYSYMFANEPFWRGKGRPAVKHYWQRIVQARVREVIHSRYFTFWMKEPQIYQNVVNQILNFREDIIEEICRHRVLFYNTVEECLMHYFEKRTMRDMAMRSEQNRHDLGEPSDNNSGHTFECVNHGLHNTRNPCNCQS